METRAPEKVALQKTLEFVNPESQNAVDILNVQLRCLYVDYTIGFQGYDLLKFVTVQFFISIYCFTFITKSICVQIQSYRNIFYLEKCKYNVAFMFIKYLFFRSDNINNSLTACCIHLKIITCCV